jgi:hypothetical protein
LAELVAAVPITAPPRTPPASHAAATAGTITKAWAVVGAAAASPRAAVAAAKVLSAFVITFLHSGIARFGLAGARHCDAAFAEGAQRGHMRILAAEVVTAKRFAAASGDASPSQRRRTA